MKNQSSMTRLAILLLGSLLLPACARLANPTAPNSSASFSNTTPTPVISAGVSEIYWYSATLSRTGEFTSPINAVDVYFSVNSLAETSDQVVLTGGNGPLTIAYNQTVTLGGNIYARYYLADGGFQYQAGTLYTLSIQTSVGTSWASITAPGGITYSVNGASVTWQTEGSNDRVYVEDSSYSGTYDSLNSQPDVDSVFTVPSAAFPSSGTYFLRATCETRVNIVNNAMAGSSLDASDELWDSVNR